MMWEATRTFLRWNSPEITESPIELTERVEQLPTIIEDGRIG
jgi:hypothetical protein